MTHTLAHIGLNVLDLNKSIEFYQNALGMHEVFRMYPKSDLDMILCFLSDERCGCMIALMWYGERDDSLPYDLGENDMNLTFTTDDFEGSYQKHKKMGIVCMEGMEKRIYYIEDPDGYQISIVPDKFHPITFAGKKSDS